jgi:hypothetical protein
MIGRLMYLAPSTRPDISYVEGILSWLLVNPVNEEKNKAANVIQYVHATWGTGLHFEYQTKSCNSVDIQIYCDADLGGEDARGDCSLTSDFRSTSSLVVMINNKCIGQIAGICIFWSKIV